jgi:hypothetical protein
LKSEYIGTLRRHEPVKNLTGNTRNGKSKKTLKGEFGELPIDVPRDRHGSFAPQLAETQGHPLADPPGSDASDARVRSHIPTTS